MSIWRYSHLTLAISSFIFIFIAAVTGVILAFEPVSNKIKPYRISNADQLNLAETLHTLQTKYEEILYLEIDDNNFVSATVVTQEGDEEKFYINPFTSEKIGDIIEKATLFEFATTLHRSLFLKSTGRFLVGWAAFLLFLIAISGTVLILKRQGNLKKYFGKVVKEGFAQYYHVVLGRLSLVPILIISLTGLYLSLLTFSILPDNTISHDIDFENVTAFPKIALQDFESFKKIPLSKVRKIEFPFSEDVEDYYHLKLKKKELIVHQYTGEVLSEILYPTTTVISKLSTTLHTGVGSILWSLILAVASINILFFIYSGFSMTLKRRRSKIKNPFKKNSCEYVILVGSEHGNTLTYAMMLHDELLKSGVKSYLTTLNRFSTYLKIKHLIIITSTYGQGDPPANARKFITRYKKNPISFPYHYAVVGFGSLAYPDFCQFAITLDQFLVNQKHAKRVLEVYTINNQSFEAYTQWIKDWATQLKLKISLPYGHDSPKKMIHTNAFRVIENTKAEAHPDDTFLMTLQALKPQRCYSGDLLEVYRKGNHQNRMYSIGLDAEKQLSLSIKRHQKGIFSNYLNTLNVNDIIQGRIIKNPNFHFPKNANHVILISNGTGIAPFLGMLYHNNTKVDAHLYWGGKNETSFTLYEDKLTALLKNKKLKKLHLAYSRATQPKIYVQHLIQRDASFVAKILHNKGVLMLCGSIAMQNAVMEILGTLCVKFNNKPLSYYEKKRQIRTDCY